MKNQKCILRPWKTSDLDDLVHHANNPKIAANLTDAFPNPYTPVEGRKFLEQVTTETPARILAIEVDGHVVGSIGLHLQTDIHRKNAELGYFLGEKYWGKGIMTDAVKQMIVYGFDHFEIDRIFARPFGRNKGSQTVLERSGFILEAALKGTLIKNGQLEDELIYGIRKNSK